MIFIKFCSVAASVLWLSQNAAADSLSDLKAVLMYFSEPYLDGAEINGMPMEGSDSAIMAKKLIEAMDALEQAYPNKKFLRESGLIREGGRGEAHS